MASITKLPNELLSFVVGNIDSLGDIAALSRTSRKLYQTVNHVLYKTAVDRGDVYPLAFAAFTGRAGTIRKLLAAGADPNAWLDEHHLIPFAKLHPGRRCCPESHERARIRRDLLDEIMSNGLADLPADQGAGYDQSTPSTADDYTDVGISDVLLADTVAAGHGHNAIMHFTGLFEYDSDEHDPDQYSSDEEDMFDEVDSMLDDSDADSSTLGYSDRYRDPVSYEDMDRLGSGNYKGRFLHPLHLAAAQGHNEAIEVLLEHGALINSPSKLLCRCERAAGMLNSLESPANEPRRPMWTPLHVAICFSRPEAAMLLLSRGADWKMECADENVFGSEAGYDSTALHYAAARGLVELVKYLVEKGHQTDVDVRDRRTLTPLYYAYANRRWDSTVPLLKEMGADINVEIQFYQPYCTITPLGEAVRLGNYEDAQKLIDLGADPNHGFIATGAGHRKGLSPLHLACMQSAQRQTGPKFLEEGGKAQQRMRIMETFIARGCDIHGTDCTGDTPLIAAAQNRVLPSVRALIKAGADVHARNSLGRTVVMQAVLGPPCPLPGTHTESHDTHHDTIRVLADILHELFAAGARIEDVDSQGNTVLHLLLDSKLDPSFRKEALRLLLNMPTVDTLLLVRNKEGRLAFQVAFYSSKLDSAEILLRRGSIQGILQPEELGSMFKYAMNDGTPTNEALELILDLDFKRVLSSDGAFFAEVVTHGSWMAALALARRGLPAMSPTALTQLLRRALNARQWGLAYQLIERGADVNDVGEYITDTPLILIIDQISKYDTYRMQKLIKAMIDRGANIHYNAGRGIQHRPLTAAIEEDSDTLVEIMLKDQTLRNDPRAANGCYLHSALRFVPGVKQYPNQRIISLLIKAGADVTEVDENGNYPLSILLEGLCSAPHLVSAYFRFIKHLFTPAVDINKTNKAGRSIADHLDQLLKTRYGHYISAKLELVDEGHGAKELRFLPETNPLSIFGGVLDDIAVWQTTL